MIYINYKRTYASSNFRIVRRKKHHWITKTPKIYLVSQKTLSVCRRYEFQFNLNFSLNNFHEFSISRCLWNIYLYFNRPTESLKIEILFFLSLFFSSKARNFNRRKYKFVNLSPCPLNVLNILCKSKLPARCRSSTIILKRKHQGLRIACNCLLRSFRRFVSNPHLST